MQRHALFAAMLSAGLLAACGGGGSDADTTPATPTSVAVTGVAAKGLMSDARVTAHAIKADGSIDDTPLGEPVYTDANGNYTLSFPGSAGTPYVVRVQAVNEGGHNTKHLDEATGTEQALPAGFTMRAVITPATASEGTVTSSASVTPFSELAVAAAAKADGGVTSANVAQAVTTVTTLLGFDPTTVVVKAPGAEGATAEQKKLALMLTAVSKLADDSALSASLGCSGDDAGARTQCVVEGLAASASATSIKLESGDVNVSNLLTQAVDAVLADPALSTEKGLDSSLVEDVKNNLACTTNCTAPTPSAATAVSAAKALISQLKSDWAALFSQGGATEGATGGLNVQAYKFRQVAESVQTPLEVLSLDAQAVGLGIGLFKDYKAGVTTQNGQGTTDTFARTDGTAPRFGAFGCSLYTQINDDGSLTELATSPANAAVIGCRATYYVTRSSTGTETITTDWRHGFTITPQADGSFAYTSRARKRVVSCTNTSPSVCTMLANEALQLNADGSLPDPSSGTVAPTLDASGELTALVVTGTLPGAFDSTHQLKNHHHTWDMNIARTTTSSSDALQATGQITSFDAASAMIEKVALKTGKVSATMRASGDATGGDFDVNVLWTAAAGAEFEGRIKAGSFARDKSDTDILPGALEVSGALRSTTQGVTTEFLSGVFKLGATGISGYDVTLPDSASNFLTLSASFTGTVTAPSRPTLEVTISAAGRSHLDNPETLTAQYRVLVDGVARSVIAMTTAVDAASGERNFALSEATSGLKLAWTNNTTTATLTKGSETVGTLSPSTKLMTFVDNSFVSLDLGL